ncbi:MBL fold metallo-hydrolase [Pseudalkalibacillus caeni]|uniref:MBL fold metallo-hydrolase n=1 Tax=Exobacillus caeni TaxID=2574798 RepID=A0A5R9F0D1_9BACL|nr:MBL fold metallo-hydrolase [Pseudalkalibacillus caeni]TLS36987.1 MBL fold metallo-hydrolase [Pseudalkalibacillus caeni]
MKVANGVDMLEIGFEAFGRSAAIYPTLIWDEKEAVLVDTGMPGQFPQILEAINNAGVPFEKLKAVILTHQDLDHVGSLPEVIKSSTNPITVYAHELDKPYIEGERPLIKSDPAKMSREEWNVLPEPVKHLYENPPKSKVDETIRNGQELPYFGGIQVIHTPGHTAGHVSLYLKQSKTLLAGDGLIAIDGSLKGPVKQTTLDLKTAVHSLKKLLDYDIESVICYHGGLCNENVKEQIKFLVEQRDEAVFIMR